MALCAGVLHGPAGRPPRRDAYDDGFTCDCSGLRAPRVVRMRFIINIIWNEITISWCFIDNNLFYYISYGLYVLSSLSSYTAERAMPTSRNVATTIITTTHLDDDFYGKTKFSIKCYDLKINVIVVYAYHSKILLITITIFFPKISFCHGKLSIKKLYLPIFPKTLNIEINF